MNASVKYLVGAAGLFLGVRLAVAATEPTAAQTVQPAQDPKMIAWQQYATPGEAHQRLNPLVGKWTCTVKSWMSAEATPEESQGTAEDRWMFGNRFVYEEFHGQWMHQPFEGIGITGYDNLRKEYTLVWLDNMGTGIMTATAQYDAANNALNEQGSFACPLTGETHRSFRGAWNIVDNNHHTYEMYMKDETGKEFKGMEIHYERVQG